MRMKVVRKMANQNKCLTVKHKNDISIIKLNEDHGDKIKNKISQNIL